MVKPYNKGANRCICILQTWVSIYICVCVYACMHVCDWILENRPDCHTRPIPFYWSS